VKRARLGWTALALAFTAAFAALGTWQLGRAHEKEQALSAYAQAQTAEPVALAELVREGAAEPSGLPRRVRVGGRYDDSITLLLDNQVLDGKAGVDVLTAFVPEDGGRAVLVDRGWLPLAPDRHTPPVGAAGPLHLSVTGLMRAPPAQGVHLGNAEFVRGATPPMLAYLDLDALERQTGTRLLRAVLQLAPDELHGYTRRWQALPNTMPPERHRGYAVQWFALALLVPLTTWVLAWRR